MTALRSNTGLAVGAVALGILIAAAGWFLVVSKQRSEAAELQGQIATVQRDIDERRAAMRQSSPQVSAAVRASDLYRLTKAVPDRVDMPGIILDLNAVATANGVAFESITPSVSRPRLPSTPPSPRPSPTAIRAWPTPPPQSTCTAAFRISKPPTHPSKRSPHG